MRRGGLGGAFALLFLACVGAAYYPGWRLERQLRDAAADGLAIIPTPALEISEEENARNDFEAAMRRRPGAVRTLFTTPSKPDPEVEALARDFAAIAARKPRYWTKYSAYNDDVVATVARVAARRAKGEAELTAAARIAGELAALRDTGGQIYWAKAADGVLDAADRLRLTGEPRRRVVAALGTPPDPREELRHHMIDVLGQTPGWSPTSSWTDRFRAFRQGKEARYIAAWRAFWRTAPSDPKGFETALGDAEESLRELELGMGRYTFMPAVFGATRKYWSQWVARLEAVRARMRT